MMTTTDDAGTLFVTGATGYVGGRLVPLLLERGWRVRAGARSLDKLACRPFTSHPSCELVQADVRDYQSLRAALEGCHAAYYLVHSMGSAGKDFASADLNSARTFARACAEAGVSRIIYLGGLGDENADLSHHLRSRMDTAKALSSSPVPVTYLRAAAILGAGSASYELLRSLVEHLPVMITPRWVHTRCQPISIRNVLDYLAGCLEHPETAGQTYDIGGPDILTYADLFQLYAQVAGLGKRLIIPVPFLSPWLSGLWIGLVTPVPPSVARPLIEGLKNEVVCRESRIRQIIPVPLQSCRETFMAARRELKDRLVPSCWADAGLVQPPEWVVCGDVPYAGGTVHEMCFQAVLNAPPETVWPFLESIGGERGWYFANFLWKIRAGMDRLCGGVGLGAGRRDPEHLVKGDYLDCFRVWENSPPNKLTLLSIMKSPGEGALEIALEPETGGCSRVTLRNRFQPRGLSGLVYWYALFIPHHILFTGLIRGLARACGSRLVSGPLRLVGKMPGSCRIPEQK